MNELIKVIAKAVWPKIDAPVEAHGHVPMTIIEFKQREAYDAAENIAKALEEAGFRIVPVEPTREMKMAAAHLKGVIAANRLIKPRSEEIYRAMLKASPHAAKG